VFTNCRTIKLTRLWKASGENT